MQIKTKSGRLIDLPTDTEDTRINVALAADTDARELDDAWFEQAQPASRLLDAAIYTQLVALKRKPGERGPQKTPTKQATTIRLSPEVLQAFRATGKGWQTRIDAALKEWLTTHSTA